MQRQTRGHQLSTPVIQTTLSIVIHRFTASLYTYDADIRFPYQNHLHFHSIYTPPPTQVHLTKLLPTNSPQINNTVHPYKSTLHSHNHTLTPINKAHAMCQILLQVYGCGHTKPICTTPCPRALATTYRNPFLDTTTTTTTNTNINTPSTPATPKTPVSPIYMAPDTPARPQHAYAGPVPSPVSPVHAHSAALSPAVSMSVPQSPTASMYDSDPTPNFCAPPHQHAKYLRPSKYP